MSYKTENGAVKKNTARDLFAPYFRARRQNMQGLANDSVFIASLPMQFQTYYTAFIAQWNEYAKGFVTGLHTRDFFTIGMGYTVCEIMAREIMNGGYRFTGDKAAAAFAEAWAETIGLEELLPQAFFMSNSVGNCILKLAPVCGEKRAFVEAYPVTRCKFSINKRGKITQATFFNRFMSNTTNSKTYAAREERVMCEGKPYYRVEVFEAGESALTFQMGNGKSVEILDESAKESFLETYGNVQCGQWYRLPFRSLGCYNIKNKMIASAISDLPGYSDSTLHTALDVLYSLDYNFTQQELDMYFGKTRVIVPPAMRAVNIGGVRASRVSQGGDYAEMVEAAPLEDEVFTKLPESQSYSNNAEANKPLFIQPDLRGDMHKIIRDADLELLASKVGLSSSTLANHLAYNTSKTATEVNQENDTTSITVRDKRKLANKAINDMLRDVAFYYGEEQGDTLKIVWNKDGMSTLAYRKQIIEEYNAGLIPLADAVKKLYPELNNEEAERWVAELESAESAADLLDPQKDLMGGLNGRSGG